MKQRLAWAAWPAFLAASVLELIVFALVDPLELQWSGHALGWSRQAVYTASFFVFWVVTLGACALTMLLRASPAELNRHS
jgi:hypothetical protein